MSKQDIESTLKEIKELQQMQTEIEQQISELQDKVKKQMEAEGTDEIKTNLFTARWQQITANRFDSKAFKADNANLYAMYIRPMVTRRFSIA